MSDVVNERYEHKPDKNDGSIVHRYHGYWQSRRHTEKDQLKGDPGNGDDVDKISDETRTSPSSS